MAAYTLQYTVDGEFDETVDAVVEALGDDGFGILCDIDVQATLKEKLDEEFREYRILGACNPPLAHEAMSEEIELGALLPCNVVVYRRDDGQVGVSAVDPSVMLSVADNPDLDPLAMEVSDRLAAAIETLPGATRVESSAEASD